MRRLAKGILLAGVVASGAGCTSVRVAQRDGCWVRQTHRTLGGTQEDVGPCVRPPPKWSDDRLTRLVQECVAQADYRWQVRALAAWNRREALPAQDAQETVIKTCMNEAATGVVTQNESLQQRLAEISGDREAFRAEATEGNQHARAAADRLAEYLGEAAKRPPPVATATATATSDGTASTESGLKADTATSGVPAGMTIAPVPVLPAAGSSGSTSSTVTPAPTPTPNTTSTPPATPTSTSNTTSNRTSDTNTATPPAADAPKTAPARRNAKAARGRTLARAARRAGCEVPPPSGVVCPSPTAAAPATPPASGDGR
jgi:hypothetical protein